MRSSTSARLSLARGRRQSVLRRLATVAVAVVTATGASILAATPASADDLLGAITAAGGIAGVADNGDGTNSLDNSVADVSTLTLGNSRTIIALGFSLASAKTLNVVVTDASDIVLFVAPSSTGSAYIAGRVNSYVGSLSGPRGGNVWFSYPGGVTVDATGQVAVGGLLATTGAVTDADFLGTDLAYAFTTTGGTVAHYGHVTGDGSLVGFVAPTVFEVAGSIVDGGSEVLFGASNSYVLTLAPRTAGGYDVLDYLPDATAASTLSLAGTTTSASLFVGGPVTPSLGGTQTVTGVVADGDGQLAIGAGWGLGRGSPTDAMGLLPLPGAAARDLVAGIPLSAPGALLLAANRSLSLAAAVSGRTVGLSTGSGPNGEPGSISGTFSRTAAGTVSASDHWVVYAQYPADVPTGATALATDQPVIWKSDVVRTPPGSVTGNRYVFRKSPEVWFEADPITKEYGEVATLTYTQTGGPEPALTGVYPADPPFTGEPKVTSDGAAADAPYLAPPLTYRIQMEKNTLVEPPGYTFHFENARLTIADNTPPTVGAATATLAGGGSYTEGTWTNEDVTVGWTCTDPASGPVDAAPTRLVQSTTTVTPGCDDVNENHADGTPFQVNIDKTAPVLSGVPANQTVTTTGTSVVVTWPAPTATDDQSTPAVVCAPPSGASFPLGQTTVTCRAVDAAGNATTGTFTVTVTQVAPPVVVTLRAPIDAAPVMNTAKISRIVPIRTTFTVGGRQITGTSAQPLSVGAAQKVSCGVSTRSDAVETFASSGTAGNLFRWSSSLKRWVFNFDQRAFGLVAGNCYRIPVLYGGTVVRNEASGGSQVGFLYLRPLK